MAECQFHLRRITDEQDRFCILVAALSKESIRMITNIIEDPPQNPYTTLKAVLLKSHQLQLSWPAMRPSLVPPLHLSR